MVNTVTGSNFDKALLTVIWIIALAATLYVSYWPPASQAVVLQTMLTVVTSVLSALMVLINGIKKEKEPDAR